MRDLLLLIFIGLLFGCSSNENKPDQTEKIEVEQLDSLINVLDNTQKSIEISKQELESALLDLEL